MLGVLLGKSLNFSEFVTKKIKTCNFHLRNLRAVKQSVPRNIRILLVTTLICSTIDFCNALLILSPKYVITSLQKVLNKAVRFIFDVKRREHISPYLCQLHILPVAYRVKYKVSVIAYKITRGEAPKYLMDKVKMFHPSCDKPFRLGAGRDRLMFHCDLAVHKSTTYVSKMIIEWNELPFALRQSENINVFKSNLKTYYFQKAFGDLCKR